MSKKEIEDQLHNFVATELLDGDADDLTAETNLLALGIIDSLSMVSLRVFIEETFAIRVPSDVQPEDFSNLAAIAAMVERLKLEAASPA